jgi:hypothetical protein
MMRMVYGKVHHDLLVIPGGDKRFFGISSSRRVLRSNSKTVGVCRF